MYAFFLIHQAFTPLFSFFPGPSPLQPIVSAASEGVKGFTSSEEKQTHQRTESAGEEIDDEKVFLEAPLNPQSVSQSLTSDDGYNPYVYESFY